MFSEFAIVKYYMLEGHEVVETSNWIEAAEQFSDGPKRTVRKTDFPNVKDSCNVSTVFLVIDHGHSMDPNARPILFETMVFGGPLHEWQRRYATWDEAEAGHEETVALVREAYKGTKPPPEEEQKYVRRTWHDRVTADKYDLD